MGHALILTAAGSSTRMGGPIKKEYLPFGDEAGVSVLSASLHAFLSTSLFSLIIITVPEKGEAEAREVLSRDSRLAAFFGGAQDGIRQDWSGRESAWPGSVTARPTIAFTAGGSTRQASILSGLEAIERIARETGLSEPHDILVHDAARPWVTGAVIYRVLETVALHGAAVPGITPVDTQKEVDSSGRIVRHLTRSSLSAVQTPQGFLFAELIAAHRKAASDGREYTDDTEIWGRYAGDVYVCQGDPANRKITYKEDLR